jgi:hypothetical protein
MERHPRRWHRHHRSLHRQCQRRHLLRWRLRQLSDWKQPEGNVIPYADLTPEIVIGWVQDLSLAVKRKVAEISSGALQKQIDEQRTPTTAAGVPWS